MLLLTWARLSDLSSFKRLTATCNEQFLSPADGGGSEAEHAHEPCVAHVVRP